MAVFDPVAQLNQGKAFVDLSFWRKVEVSGADAGTWLRDLVSADLTDLEDGRSRPSLLLSPTGRIRAAFTVARFGGTWLLIQDPEQSRPVEALLASYVLSSDVDLTDRTEALALFALPGHHLELEIPHARPLAPSSLGGGGLDLLASIEDHGGVKEALEARFVAVGNEAVEEWRVVMGIPKFGVDATEDDLPQEGALDDAVAFDKGCYLGQEAVAKVRNLGHPRRLVLHMRADGAVSAGETVRSGGEDVGLVTSAARLADETVVLARVAWDARGGPLETATGIRLVARQASSPV
jgi:folate-binding protein YgfZ